MLIRDLPDLPVVTVLPELDDALGRSGAAVLVAPPGTGKTTVVPLVLADRLGGRVVVAEPRRIAARAAAARMASLTGTQVGDRVGFAVRGERRSGRRTVVEVVTTGVLLRRLQRDPELPGVSAVVVDECHERHLDADLLLAMLADVRGTLRGDLRVLATSATAQADLFADVLGDGVLGAGSAAPVVTATVPVHDLQVRWAPPPAGTRPPHGTWVDPRLLDHVTALTVEALRDSPFDGLVIAPGAREVDTVRAALRSRLPGRDVLALHGRLPAAVQDEALRPGRRPRVVVATAVAESSLTVPGVRVVVDAGLARRPRTDHARGLSALVTTRLSRAEADQRAGRANREGPGTVVRCWPQAEHDRLPRFPPPEVEQADLAGFALELACWGTPGGQGMRLPTPPPDGPMAVATELLTGLGALDGAGRATDEGRRMARVAAHPRLAHALLVAARRVGSQQAAEVVALLAADRVPDGDLAAALREVRRSRDPSWRRLVSQLLDQLGDDSGAPRRSGVPDDVAVATVVAAAFPDRVARRRSSGDGYLMTGGTAARLPSGSPLTGAPWLAVAVADRAVGRADAQVRAAVATSEETVLEAASALRTTQDEVAWVDGDVLARRVDRLGAIPLSQVALPSPPPHLVRDAVAEGLRREGLGLLRWSAAGRSMRERMAFLHQAIGEPWPDVSDDALAGALDAWLPGVERVRRRADLQRLDTTSGLRALLPWPQASRLDDLAPERIAVPSGSSVRVDYSGDQPVLAVRVQELFGWSGPPALADGRVPVLLHLLSPAGRPAAVTADLESFWRNGYAAVRADLRGRYPKHAWPQDPLTAPPARGTRPRRS